jgi:hypothetical protein
MVNLFEYKVMHELTNPNFFNLPEIITSLFVPTRLIGSVQTRLGIYQVYGCLH